MPKSLAFLRSFFSVRVHRCRARDDQDMVYRTPPPEQHFGFASLLATQWQVLEVSARHCKVDLVRGDEDRGSARYPGLQVWRGGVPEGAGGVREDTAGTQCHGRRHLRQVETGAVIDTGAVIPVSQATAGEVC